jgi:hypothetical protein
MFASTWRLSPITARNLVVHELGHVFSRILSSSTANYGNNSAGDILYKRVWQGNWAKLNCNDDWPNRWKTAYGPNYGFASDGEIDLTWQLHFMQDRVYMQQMKNLQICFLVGFLINGRLTQV